MSTQKNTLPAPRVRESVLRLRQNIARVIQGKDDVIDRLTVCLVAGGHLLIEDLPGLGKTTLAYCLARSIDCGFSRIQFTSDLLPSDVLGVSIYDESVREFVFKKGPIFANIVLADEINRTTPKTQSALLEAMDRGKISMDGQTYSVASPFMVVATQNPVDYEGTFPLPESQMDRFLMRLSMGYPDWEHELDILQRTNAQRGYDSIEADSVLNRQEILEIQQYVPQVFIEDSLYEYLLRIVTATRTEAGFRSGVSTRGTLALKLAAQARALCEGRSFVIPEDIQESVRPVFAHRLSLERQVSDSLEERRTVEGMLKKIVEAVPDPS